MKEYRKENDVHSNKKNEAGNRVSLSRSLFQRVLRNMFSEGAKKLWKINIHNFSKIIPILLVLLLFISSINLQALTLRSLSNHDSLEHNPDSTYQCSDYGEDDVVRYDFTLNFANAKQVNSQDQPSVFTQKAKSESNDLSLFSVELKVNEAMEFEQEFNKLNKKFLKQRDPVKMREYSEKALDLYIEYEILPDCFTYENISDLIYQLSTSFASAFSNISLRNDPKGFVRSPDNSGLTVNVAFPFSVLSYLNIFGSVKPFGLSHKDGNLFFTAIPGVRNLTILNLTINKTGWFIKAESLPDHPLFPRLLEDEISWIIDGPIWEYIWRNSGEGDYLQYKTFFGIGIYNFVHILLGNAITAGSFIGPQLDGRQGQIKMNQPFIGNFIWVGLPYSFPFSFTLYKTYPTPWSVGLEVGIVPVLGGSALTSLLYLRPQ